MGMKKAAFYLKRMRAMSFPEIFYRARWKLNQEIFMRINLNPQVNLSGVNISSFKNKGNFVFEKTEKSKIIREYKKNFSIKHAKIVADAFCKEIPVFDSVASIESIDWNKDYKTGKSWPIRYVGDLHHEDTRYGYVRYVWELNRHSHLPAIAKAYYLTGDEKYAESALSQIELWIDANPYLKSINWFSGLELGIRVINWIWTLKFVHGYIKTQRLKVIAKSIILQCETIMKNLSLYSSANNHLTGEVAALLLAARVFPDISYSERWRNTALYLFNKETINQIYEDGVGAEQSVNYLLFIIDLYLQAFIVSGEGIPDAYNERLRNAGFFLYGLSQNRTGLPDIGDSDYAHLIDFNPKESKAESIMNSISILFGEQGIASKDIDEQSFWIFGIDGLKKFSFMKKQGRKPKNKINYNSRFLEKGGYLISLSKKSSLIFDCGSLGYLSTAGHGHCDALSFILSVRGKELFTDPGTYIYHGNRMERDYFRSTSSHNTLMVDGREQSEFAGNFIYARKAKVKVKEVQIHKDFDKIVASHDGYSNIGVIHEREIIHNKILRQILIIDRIRTSGKHNIKLNFIFHPKIKISKSYLLDGKVQLSIDKNMDSRIVKAWYSRSFGVKEETLKIEAKARSVGNAEYKTVITF